MIYGGKDYIFNPYLKGTVTEVIGLGVIESVDIIDPGYYPNTVSLGDGLIFNISASNGNLTIDWGFHFFKEGYYSNSSGLLVSGAVLQDSEYYQSFSYQINSDIPLEEWESIVERVLHPAGMKVFSGLDVHANSNYTPSPLRLTPKVIESYIPITYYFLIENLKDEISSYYESTIFSEDDLDLNITIKMHIVIESINRINNIESINAQFFNTALLTRLLYWFYTRHMHIYGNNRPNI